MKSTAPEELALSLLLCQSWLLPTALLAQQKAVAPVPSTPSEILATAARNNGLASVKQPWHAKVSYEIVAYDGSPQDSGTYEEFWVSAKQYKRIYTSAKFNQTDVGNGHSLYRSGDQNWPGLRESQVRTLMLQPVPADLDLRDVDLGETTRSFGTTKLPCVVVNSKRKTNVRVIVIGQSILSAHYCFEPGRPVLRFASQGAGRDDTFFNNPTIFQGQYLAREIRLTNSQERLVLTVESIEGLTTVNDSDFAPPVGAVGPLGDGGIVSVKSASLTVLKRTFPIYPDAAKRRRIQGTVVMQATIGKDGLVKNIQVVDGPTELRQAAVQSLQQWQFRPFLILDEPVDVSTRIEIAFTLG